ncbi:MAG: hypothetical protein NTY38_23705, partial [Acidobacteria bacterium]|nr:hypothetical protein [Acidobacteriota bacterium]
MQPVGLEIEVRDDCGHPVDSAAVSVGFSERSGVAGLTPVGGGLYRGVWTPALLATNVPEVEVWLRASAQVGSGGGSLEG